MRCPHCGTGIRLETTNKVYSSSANPGIGFEVAHGLCPECKGLVVTYRKGESRWIEDQLEIISVNEEHILYPKIQVRMISSHIPESYRQEFNEANAVLSVSAKASAALSRRLLQNVLRNEFKVLPSELANEIEEFKQKNIPSHLLSAVEQIRQIGNYAAHPIKSRYTSSIVEVEKGEAEWLLDILEDLLDFTFVQPGVDQERKKKWEAKLNRSKK